MSDASSDEDFAGWDQNDVNLASSRFAGTFHQINEPTSNVSVPEYSSSVGQSSEECGRDPDSDGSQTSPACTPPHSNTHSINYC